ncbi:MAG: hypothetical protein EDX89_03930 [Acidobacteria bacterium]|nr:MAG: hypothetical protein EDX89_03930 [Acidobacteriota bacterium]MCE7959348.1 hypothetical protein [Acidobacteria bacterium ACB2]
MTPVIRESWAWGNDLLVSPGPLRPGREVATLVASVAASVLVLFLLFEGVETALDPPDETRHRLHYARGVTTSLVTATVAAALAIRQRRRRARFLEEEVGRRTAELAEARTLLQVVVDSTPASLLVLDRDYRVVTANRRAALVHGTEVAGRTCFEALAGTSVPCPSCPATGTFAEAGAPCAAHQHTDPRTGEVLEVESHPLTLPDGRRWALLVERVVTEQQKLQARLLHQEKMAAFGLLSAGIAHDLGNPLASVEAQLQLLDDASLPPEAAGVVAGVRGELARLRRLLRELVDFARRRRTEVALVDVRSVVEDALRVVRHDPRMRGVALETEFDPEAPPVTVVEDHLVQVVLNLLLNSLDALPRGGRLRVAVVAVRGRVVLRVEDTGSGMERSVLARCFEPLFTTKEPGKGTGLGLSIARDILRAAGGGIELHSAPGRGTTAVVTLPAAEEAAAPRPGEAVA